MREDTQGALSHSWEQGWRTVDGEVLERGERGERAPAQCRRRPRQRGAALSWKLAMVFSVQRHTSAVWRLPRPISRVVAWWCDGAAVPASALRRSREGRGEAHR